MDLNLTIAHSVLEPDFKLTEFLEREYNIGNITKIIYWIRSTNDHYLVETETELYILRIHTHKSYWLNDTDGPQFELDLLNFLKKRGLQISEPVIRRNGKFFGSISAPEGRRWVTLFKFLKGEIHDRPNQEQVELIGEALATFHNQTTNFDVDYTLPKRDFNELVKNKVQWIEEYWSNDKKSEINRINVIVKKLEEKILQKDKTKENFGIITSDFHHWNCIFTENKLSLFDFDYAGIGWRIYDLAVFKWGLERSGSESKLWDQFLDAYQSVRRLSDEELEMVPFFVLVRMIWRLGSSINFINRFGHFSYNHFFNQDFEKISKLADDLF